MALGFTRLLAGLDDAALDIPDAARLMELFLGAPRGACFSRGRRTAHLGAACMCSSTLLALAPLACI